MTDAKTLMALSTLRECMLDLTIDFWIQKKELKNTQEEFGRYKLVFSELIHTCPKCEAILSQNSPESWTCTNCNEKFHISYLLAEKLGENKPKKKAVLSETE